MENQHLKTCERIKWQWTIFRAIFAEGISPIFFWPGEEEVTMKHWNFCGTNQMRMPYAQLGSAPRRTVAPPFSWDQDGSSTISRLLLLMCLIYYNQYKYLPNIVILYIYVYIIYYPHYIYIYIVYIYIYCSHVHCRGTLRLCLPAQVSQQPSCDSALWVGAVVQGKIHLLHPCKTCENHRKMEVYPLVN